MNCKIIGLLLVIFCPIIEMITFKLAKRTVDESKGEFITLTPQLMIPSNVLLCFPIVLFFIVDLKMDDIIWGILGSIFISILIGTVHERFTNDEIESKILGKTMKSVKLSKINGYYLGKDAIKVMTENDTIAFNVRNYNEDVENLMKAHGIGLHPIYQPVEVYDELFYRTALYISVALMMISTVVGIVVKRMDTPMTLLKIISPTISTVGLIIVISSMFSFVCAIKIDEDTLTYNHLFKKPKSIPLCEIESCTLKEGGTVDRIITINGDTIEMPRYKDEYNLVERFANEHNWIAVE